jgi:hypothetical protein
MNTLPDRRGLFLGAITAGAAAVAAIPATAGVERHPTLPLVESHKPPGRASTSLMVMRTTQRLAGRQVDAALAALLETLRRRQPAARTPAGKAGTLGKLPNSNKNFGVRCRFPAGAYRRTKAGSGRLLAVSQSGVFLLRTVGVNGSARISACRMFSKALCSQAVSGQGQLPAYRRRQRRASIYELTRNQRACFGF